MRCLHFHPFLPILPSLQPFKLCSTVREDGVKASPKGTLEDDYRFYGKDSCSSTHVRPSTVPSSTQHQDRGHVQDDHEGERLQRSKS